MEQAKKWDKTTQKKRKEYYANRSKVMMVKMKSEDRVLLSQKKSLVDPPFNQVPYTLMKVEGTRVTIQRGDSVKTQNPRRLKLVKERLSQLV